MRYNSIGFLWVGLPARCGDLYFDLAEKSMFALDGQENLSMGRTPQVR